MEHLQPLNTTELTEIPLLVNTTTGPEASTCDIKDTTFTFVINGIIIGLLCIFGLLGNTLSIFVLQRDPNNKVAIFLLQSLAVADNSLLLVCFITLSMWKGVIPFVYDDMKELASSMVYISVFINPLGAMTQTATVWLTVLLALNRYLAVCKPFKAQILCTLKRAKIQVICVVIFAFVFNFPMFFQFQIVQKIVQLDDANDSKITTQQLEPTIIGYNTMFGIIYTNALYSVLVLILPLLLLICLNCQLVRAMQQIHKRTYQLTDSAPQRSEHNISLIMIIIIVIFIVCQTPDRILQVFRLLVFHHLDCSVVKHRMISICNLLIVINSSTNFIIYYMFRKSFRRILRQKVCFSRCVSARPDDQPISEDLSLHHVNESVGNIQATALLSTS